MPQNWDEADGSYLDIAFVVVLASGENPEPDPLIHLAGGPGSSAILSIENQIKKYQTLRLDRDLIFIITQALSTNSLSIVNSG